MSICRTGRLQDWQRQHVERMYEAYELTRQQRAICDRLLAARANGEIASDLGLCDQTVKNHIVRINRCLGTQDRLQIVLVLLGVIAVPNPEQFIAAAEAKIAAAEAQIAARREHIDMLRRGGDAA